MQFVDWVRKSLFPRAAAPFLRQSEISSSCLPDDLPRSPSNLLKEPQELENMHTKHAKVTESSIASDSPREHKENRSEISDLENQPPAIKRRYSSRSGIREISNENIASNVTLSEIQIKMNEILQSTTNPTIHKSMETVRLKIMLEVSKVHPDFNLMSEISSRISRDILAQDEVEEDVKSGVLAVLKDLESFSQQRRTASVGSSQKDRESIVSVSSIHARDSFISDSPDFGISALYKRKRSSTGSRRVSSESMSSKRQRK